MNVAFTGYKLAVGLQYCPRRRPLYRRHSIATRSHLPTVAVQGSAKPQSPANPKPRRRGPLAFPPPGTEVHCRQYVMCAV